MVYPFHSVAKCGCECQFQTGNLWHVACLLHAGHIAHLAVISSELAGEKLMGVAHGEEEVGAPVQEEEVGTAAALGTSFTI